MLASEREAKLSQFTGSRVYDVKNEKYWRLIPTYDVRFGLSYLITFEGLNCLNCCPKNYDCNLEIGYEFISCSNGVERLLFYDDIAESASFNEMMTFALHGPYVHFALVF